MQLLSKTHVRARVEQLQAERNERVRVDADFVLTRLAEELQADVNDLFEEDGRIKPTSQWPMPWRRGLIAGVKINELWEVDPKTGKKVHVGVTKELQFADRGKRLELAGRHINVGAFRDKLQVAVGDPLAELFRQIQGQSIRPAIELHANPAPTGASAPASSGSEPIPRPGLPYTTNGR